MTIKDIAKQCGCKYAVPNKVERNSTTRYIVCKLHNRTTDIQHCKKCKESEK